MTTNYVRDLAKAIKENTGVKDFGATIEGLVGAYEKKSKRSVDVLLFTGFMAGAFVAFGGYLMLLTGGNLGNAYPDGIKKLVSGFVFPIGIILVIYCATDLFTGNTLIMPMGMLLKKTLNPTSTLKVWITCYIGNCLGAMFVAFVFVYLLNDPEQAIETNWGRTAIAIAKKKLAMPWWKLIISGVGANWMVCLSVFIGARQRDGAGKIIAYWWPIFAFVCMGFEHCIANCFFIPVGILFGVEGGIGIFNNLIFSTIGNIIGGTGFTCFILWYVYKGSSIWHDIFNNLFAKTQTHSHEEQEHDHEHASATSSEEVELEDTTEETEESENTD